MPIDSDFWFIVGFAKFIWSILLRLKLEGAKKKQENELKHVNEQLEIYGHDIEHCIEEITSKVKDQVI